MGAAQQSPTNKTWFQGTADAVRQYTWLFNSSKCDEYLILSGDHLYRMDYKPFIMKHREVGADITVSAVPMDEERAEAMAVDTTVLGLDAEKAKEMPYIASMGIYVFSAKAMEDLLMKHCKEQNDFGGEIIPHAKDMACT